MTVVVAARTRKDGIVIAADSEITDGWQKSRHANPKIWINEDRIFAFAGHMRTAQVVQHQTEWPYIWPDGDTASIEAQEEFLVRGIWPAIRTAVTDNGVLHTEHGFESVDAIFILAWGSTLAEFDSTGGVSIPPSGRTAIGSGYAEALGHLGNAGPWTKNQVIQAAKRARISAVGVGGPIFVTSTKSLTIEQVSD